MNARAPHTTTSTPRTTTSTPRPGEGPMRGPMGRGPRGGGPGHAMMPGEKARDFKGTMRTLIRYLGAYKAAIAVVAVCAIASTAASIAGPKILGRATTQLFEGLIAQLQGAGAIDFDAIGRILLMVVGLYLFSALASMAQGWIMADVSTNLAYRLRRNIAEKINHVPLKTFDATTQGEVLSRITNDVDTVNQTLSQSLTQIVTSTVTVVGVLIMMLSISWVMTLVAILVMPLSTVAVLAIVKQSQKYFVHQQEYLGHLNGHVEEMYGGHLVMKAFNGEAASVRTFETYNDELYTSGWKSQFLSGLLMPITMVVGNLGYVAVAVLGGWMAAQGRITVGDIQAFIQYVRSFSQPIQQLANISNTLQQTAAAAERVFEFLDTPEEVSTAVEVSTTVEGPTAVEASPAVGGTEIAGHVTFRDVRFGYDPANPVIQGFSADVKPGQKIAIVGPTGAGKTTMVKLLMRFYDVDGGAILVDERDIRTFSRHDLRKLFGMVLQDTWLFHGTIMENIRYGRPDAADDEVIAAAQTAHVDHFVRTLPDGYLMEINEEASNISQGQKQLLTIARAVLADPPMLILDEATSSVDTRTEILIQQAMDRLMEGRTSFIIAHRLSTIRNADLILVMDEGNIVETGAHTELLARGGFYAKLYNSQFEAVPVLAGV